MKRRMVEERVKKKMNSGENAGWVGGTKRRMGWRLVRRMSGV